VTEVIVDCCAIEKLEGMLTVCALVSVFTISKLNHDPDAGVELNVSEAFDPVDK
jgi:hypothetical protein